MSKQTVSLDGPFTNISMQPERRLWVSVLAQAVKDAEQDDKEGLLARKFLTSVNAGLVNVCHAAGFNVERVVGICEGEVAHKMRLSTAIALGRTLVPEMKAKSYKGCAVGMALKAVGIELKGSGDVGKIMNQWPWAFQPPTYYIQEIFYKFDEQVMTGKMTLDSLIDYVRSIEPPQDDGQPQQEVTESEKVSVYAEK